jgi:hypothetical protein
LGIDSTHPGTVSVAGSGPDLQPIPVNRRVKIKIMNLSKWHRFPFCLLIYARYALSRIAFAGILGLQRHPVIIKNPFKM